MYPFETPEGVQKLEIEPTMMQVDAVRCLESDLVENTPTSVATRIQTGWKARLVARRSSRKMCVRVPWSIGNKQLWIQAAESRRFVHTLINEGGTRIPDFNIALRNGAYEVLDVLQEEIVILPKIPVNSDRAISIVMDIVEHLPTFKYFEGIHNRQNSLSFGNSFSIIPQYDTLLLLGFHPNFFQGRTSDLGAVYAEFRRIRATWQAGARGKELGMCVYLCLISPRHALLPNYPSHAVAEGV